MIEPPISKRGQQMAIRIVGAGRMSVGADTQSIDLYGVSAIYETHVVRK